MADVTNMLKAELGIKSDKPEHHHHHHHHDKIIVPSTELTTDVTHKLQSQLGQGKEVDQEIQQEKNKAEGKGSSLSPKRLTDVQNNDYYKALRITHFFCVD